MLKENDNGTVTCVTLSETQGGQNDFFLYLVSGNNYNSIEIVGKCITVIDRKSDTGEVEMKITNTKILDEYQGKVIDGVYSGNHYGETLLDEVFKHAKSIGVNKVSGIRTFFDTSTKDEADRWNAFWIEHYKCTATSTGFYKILK